MRKFRAIWRWRQGRVERGEPAREAERAQSANLERGLVKEVTRDVWGWAHLNAFDTRLRFGVRMLAKSPGLPPGDSDLGAGIAQHRLFSVVKWSAPEPSALSQPGATRDTRREQTKL